MSKYSEITDTRDNTGLDSDVKPMTNNAVNNLFDLSPTVYFNLTAKGLILNINSAGVALTGLTRDDLIGKVFAKFILQEDRNTFMKSWLTLLDTKITQVCEIRISFTDSRLLWLKLSIFFNESGEENEIVLAASDISFQKQIKDVQSFLLESSWSKSGRDFFEALAEYLSKTLGMEYVCIDRLLEKNLEAQTVAVYFNGKTEDNTRYLLKDTPCGKVVEQEVCYYPRNVSQIFPEDAVLREMCAESYAGITLRGSNGKPIGLIAVIGSNYLENPDSVEMLLKQVSIRAANELEHRQLQESILNSQKKLEVLVKERTKDLQQTNRALNKEIKARREKEKSLLQAEEKYRTVADFTYDWETWVGPDGKFIYVSPSCMPTTGYTVEEFMNDPMLVVKITHPEDREHVENHYIEKKKKNLPSCSIDFRIIKRDGEVRWIGHSCQPVFNSDGVWIGQRGSNRDITPSKKTENNLLSSQLQLRALTKRMDAVAEEERTRISREIHDELGHLITAIKFDIQCLYNKKDINEKHLKKELASMTCMLDFLIDSVRKIATELRPGILDHFGFCHAIEWQIEQFKKRTNIQCEYLIIDKDIDFDKDVTTIIYRILQEILTNITRHSEATKVYISLSQKDGWFSMSVSDNGIGFEVMDKHDDSSLGLMGMYERALSIGGELKIESVKGEGTNITLRLEKNKS